MTTFRVRGIPVPQGSMRALLTKQGRAVAVNSNSSRLALWRNDVVEAAAKCAPAVGPLQGAVSVRLEFRLPRPKSHYRTGANADLLRDAAPLYPAKAPDIDKLTRCILDALTVAGFINDDALVVALDASKRFATLANPSGVRIEVTAL